MRLFVAADGRDAGIAVMQQLPADVASGFRMVPEAQLHLTLLFLGEVAPADTPSLEALFATLALGPPFDLFFDRLVGLPQAARARVLATRARKAAAFDSLARVLAAPLATFGDARRPHGPPLPHITLGRRRQPGPMDSQRHPPVHLAVRCVHLIESRLRPAGPSYRILATRGLDGPPPGGHPREKL